jgi:hypothetical protein
MPARKTRGHDVRRRSDFGQNFLFFWGRYFSPWRPHLTTIRQPITQASFDSSTIVTLWASLK